MKCPSCGYLAFGAISTCPKCGELLKETAVTGDLPAADDLFGKEFPEAPRPDLPDDRLQDAHAGEETPRHEDPVPAGPVPESHHREAREWTWEGFTPPDMKRPKAAASPSLFPKAPVTLCMAAGVLDHAFVVVATVGLIFLSSALAGQDLLSIDLVGILPSLILFLFVIDGVYFTFFHGLGASTFGETIFRIVLLSTDGTPLTFSRAFLRWMSSLMSTVLLGLGLLWGWHDAVTKTSMVRKM